MHRPNSLFAITISLTLAITTSLPLAQSSFTQPSPIQTIAAKSPQPIQPIRRIQINKAELISTPIAASTPRPILQIQRLKIS